VKPLAERLICLACVCIMLIAGLQVLTINASADGNIETDDSSSVNASESLSRLTVSNERASYPSATVTNAVLHIAWADGSSPSMTLCWKYSSDETKTFSSDQPLSPTFFSISNVQIASSPEGIIAILFEGQLTEMDPTGIYIVCSPDGGKNWTQVSFVTIGTSSALAVHGNSLFIGLNRQINDSNVFSLVMIQIDGTALENGVSLISLNVQESKVRLYADQDALYLGLIIGPDYRQIAFGIIDYSGYFLLQPTVIWQVSDGWFQDLQMASVGGFPVAVITYDHETGATIEYGQIGTDFRFWSFSTLLSDDKSFSDISLLLSGGYGIMAWESESEGLQAINWARIDCEGNGVHIVSERSILDLANSPSVVSLSPGRFDIVLARPCDRGQEIFMEKDLTFEKMNIVRLMRWIGQHDSGAFFNDATIKAALIKDLANITESFICNDAEGAHGIIAHMLGDSDGFRIGDVPLNILDTSSADVYQKVTDTLTYYATVDELSDDELVSANALTTMAYGDPDDSIYITDLVVTNVGYSNVRIDWRTNVVSTSRVDYGPTESYGSSINGEDGFEHSITLVGLLSGTYHYRVSSTSLEYYRLGDVVRSADSTFDVRGINNLEVTVLTSHSVQITWDTDVASTTVVDYGTSTSYGTRVTGASGTSHSVILTNLVAGTAYHYRVTSISVTNSSDSAQSMDQTFTAKIIISNRQLTVLSSTSVLISWETNIAGTTVVDYDTRSSSYGHSASGSSGLTHSVTLTGLSPGEKYYYRITSKSITDNNDVAQQSGLTFTAQIVISNVASNILSSTSVQISWVTNIAGTTVVEYGPTDHYDYTVTGASGTSHSVIINGLTPGRTYYYTVTSVSTSSSADRDEIEDMTFIAKIIISDVVATTLDPNNVVITWNTNFNGTSVVDYGIGPGYGTTITGSSGTSHSVTITGLSSKKTYHYRVKSVSSSSSYDVGQSGDLTFTTPGIVISNVVVTSTGFNSVLITWDTDASGSSKVSYSTDTSYRYYVTGSSGTSHSVTINGLLSGTLYHYLVTSVSVSNSADTVQTGDNTFNTSGINGVVVIPINSTAVQIVWSTDYNSSSVVNYGITASYVSTATGDPGTFHFVIISGLSAVTTYHYKLTSVSTAIPGDTAQTSDRTFIARIVISDVSVNVLNSTAVQISWRTNYNGSTLVNYGTSTSYGSASSGASGTLHTITLDGLVTARTYHYKITSVSTTSGYDSSTTTDATFTTNGISISDVVASTIGFNSVLITWTTDADGTSIVRYGTSTSYTSYKTGASGTSHSVTLTGLSAGTSYHFVVSSTSSSNQNDIEQSIDYSFFTYGMSNIAVLLINSTTVKITWDTDINATSVIDYGLTHSYGLTSTGASGTSHSVTLTNLNPASTYHYRVTSVSTGTDKAVSADKTFIAQIAISDITATAKSPSSAEIRWTTNYEGSSIVEYDTTQYYYGNTVTGTSGIFHSVTITGLDSLTTYHFRVRSVSTSGSNDNVRSSDYTFTTLGIKISNVIGTIVNDTSAQFTWTTDVAGTTRLYYSIDTSYSSSVTGSSGIYHSVTLTGLSSNKTYYFKVQSASTSNSQDIAYASGYVLTTNGINVSSVVITIIGADQVQIDWTTNVDGNSRVYYGTSLSYGNSRTGTTGISHTVVLSSLIPGTTYHFKAASVSSTNSQDTDSSGDYSFTTPGIEINDIVIAASSSTSVTISWESNILGEVTARIYYGTSITYDRNIISGHSGRDSEVTISGLTPDTTYHYQIVIHSGIFGDFNISDATFVTGIQISNIIVSSIEPNRVVISWVTDIQGDTQVYYGTSTTYGRIVTNSNWQTAHSIMISELSSDTLYHLKVASKSRTASSDIAQSGDITFRTTCIAISNVGITIISLNSVRISWNTNTSGSSVVYYGTDTTYPSTKSENPGSLHQVTITGLSPGITYHFRVSSASESNAGDVAYSGDDTFLTNEVVGVTATITGFNSVIITWSSSTSRTSLVYYDTTTSYSHTADGTSGTSHSVVINGLTAGTTYYFKVSSASVTNPANIVQSADYTFVTYGISNVVKTATGFNSVQITWNTDIEATSIVHYGTTLSYGSSISGNSGTTHSITITGLLSGTTYYFEAYSASTSNSSDVAHVPNSVATLGYSNMVVSVTGFDTAQITWSTSIVGTSVVYYGTTTSYGLSATGGSGTYHLVNLTGLASGTTYYFKIYTVSSSNSSDIMQKSDFTFTFTTSNKCDAGLAGTDAGDASHSIIVIPCVFIGDLYSPFDKDDYYKVYLLSGQNISASLQVPTTFDLDIYIFNPQSILKASACSRATGGTENVWYIADSTGYWFIDIRHYSGAGDARYTVTMGLSSASLDHNFLQVGSVNDNDPSSHMQTFSMLDGWLTPSGYMRSGSGGSTVLFNLYDGTYQMNTDYMVTFTYYAGGNVIVQMYNGVGWVDIGTLPGKTAQWAASVIIPCTSFYDSMPGVPGMNIELRFSNALLLYWIDYVSYSFVSDLSTGGHCPGTAIESGWSSSGGVLNGTSGATMLVNIPRTDILYELQFNYLDARDGMEVQQLTSTGYVSIGVLRRTGQYAVILLNSHYYDAVAGMTGTNVRIKLMSPLFNLTSVHMAPAKCTTDVGVAGDTNALAHMLGLYVYDNGQWSAATTVDTQTFRQAMSANAAFVLDAPVTDKGYEIKVTYKSAQAGSFVIWDGISNSACAMISGDNQWHEATFNIKPSQYYDSSSTGEMNVMMKVTVSGVYIDSMSASVDSDGDGLSDAYESNRVGNLYALDPYSTDTDQDNLIDSAELTARTNPTNPDTDNDGLLDGNEQWSQTWSTESMYTVPDYYQANGYLKMDIAVPGLTRITGAQLIIGIIHSRASDLKVSIQKDSGSKIILQPQGSISGSNLFTEYNLLISGYSTADFTSGHTWHVYVFDCVSNGIGGQVQYARMQVSGTTDPLDSDTDNDGILDGEEVNAGADGWVTNPISSDTDHDYVSDYNEIHGSTLCDEPLDPTRADTDGDGYNDNVDRALGNRIMCISIYELGYVSGPTNAFFAFRNLNGNDYWTDESWFWYNTINPNFVYYIDIPDDASLITFDVQAWYEGGSLGDSQIKFSGGSNCVAVAYSPGGTANVEWSGDQLRVGMSFSTVVQQTANLIVVSGVNGDDEYGLEQYGSEYRYSADEQMFVVYVKCSGSGYGFVNGMNTILVPRSVALSSSMNQTFSDLYHLAGGTVFAGRDIEVLSRSSGDVSGSVAMVLAATLSPGDALKLLNAMIHDASNVLIGESTRIYGNAIYRLHLPLDVLKSIGVIELVSSPAGTPAQGFGEAFYDAIVHVVVGALNFLASVVDFFVDLGLAVIAALNELTYDMSAAVAAAIDKVVDAFAAFVTWAINYIQSLASSVLTQHADLISSSSNSQGGSLSAVAYQADHEYGQNGTVSQATNQKLVSMLSDFVSVALVLVIALDLILLATKILTAGMSFLVGLCVAVVAQVLIVNIMKIAMEDSCSGQSHPFSLYDTSINLGLSMGMSDPHAEDALFWICGIIDAVVLNSLAIIVAAATCQIDLILAILAGSLSMYAFINDDEVVGLIGLAMGCASLLITAGELFVNWALDLSEEVETKILSGLLDFTSVAIGAHEHHWII